MIIPMPGTANWMALLFTSIWSVSASFPNTAFQTALPPFKTCHPFPHQPRAWGFCALSTSVSRHWFSHVGQRVFPNANRCDSSGYFQWSKAPALPFRVAGPSLAVLGPLRLDSLFSCSVVSNSATAARVHSHIGWLSSNKAKQPWTHRCLMQKYLVSRCIWKNWLLC